MDAASRRMERTIPRRSALIDARRAGIGLDPGQHGKRWSVLIKQATYWCAAAWTAVESRKEACMPMKRIRLELARDHNFPEGSRQRGYEFAAPLDAQGHLLADAWHAMPEKCRVKR